MEPLMPTSPLVDRLLRLALEEDLAQGDVTSESLGLANRRVQGRIVARQELVLAGLSLADRVMVSQGARLEPRARDGARLEAGRTVAVVQGSARAVLSAERTALNFLQRLSGIATLTSFFVERVAGTGVRIVDTRKTTPGWRLLEKYAVRCGGGGNHRFSLGDGVLIKDNHIAALGSVDEAVRRARAAAPHTLRVEVEVDDLDQLEAALAVGAEVVLLDNMNPEELVRAVALTKGRALLEASGGITLETVRAVADTGVDLISVGALTHSACSVDLALDLEEG